MANNDMISKIDRSNYIYVHIVNPLQLTVQTQQNIVIATLNSRAHLTALSLNKPKLNRKQQ